MNSGLLIAGSTLLSRKLFAEPTAAEEILGIQLYSVRDDMRKDPKGVLKQLSDMGYKYVEHANYGQGRFYGFTRLNLKKSLTGLACK